MRQPAASKVSRLSKLTSFYLHVHFWPWGGDNLAFAGLRNKVKSVTLLASGQKVDFEQDDYRVRFKGLPEKAPDDPITTLAIECDSEPRQEELFVRRRERGQV